MTKGTETKTTFLILKKNDYISHNLNSFISLFSVESCSSHLTFFLIIEFQYYESMLCLCFDISIHHYYKPISAHYANYIKQIDLAMFYLRVFIVSIHLLGYNLQHQGLKRKSRTQETGNYLLASISVALLIILRRKSRVMIEGYTYMPLSSCTRDLYWIARF